MASSGITRKVLPFLAFTFLQIFQIQSENDLDYSLESPTLLTTSEIAEEIMNQNLNLNCAGLKEFFNSETYQDVEKILNMTSNSTEIIENREQYHSRIKRCSEMERQNKILREFEIRNRKNDFIGNRKPNRDRFKPKHQKDSNSPPNHDSKKDTNEDDVLRGDLTQSMHDSASTDLYLRTYRTVTGNLSQLTTNSASLKTFTTDNREKQQSNSKNIIEKESEMLKENRPNINNSSTISYSTPHTISLLQLNEPDMRSTISLENKEKKKKGLLTSLLGNIRNVMEGGSYRNIDESSKFDPSEKSSLTENVTDEESLLEYETVTPHQLINLNNLEKFGNEQNLKGTSSLSTAENFQIVREKQDETKKQLQSKIDELIRIRKKILEIARIIDPTKNQTKISSGGFNRSSNKKKVKAATGKKIFSRGNSKNDLDSKRKSGVKNEIDKRNDSFRHRSSLNPLSSISTSFENSSHETTKSSLLKMHDVSINFPIEQNEPTHHTSELPKHNFSKHVGLLNPHVSNPDLSKNRDHLDSFFSPRSQDIEKNKNDGDINFRKTSKIEENIIKTTPSKSSSTFNLMHAYTKQNRNTEDPFILRSSTKSPLKGKKVTEISSPTMSKIESFPTQFEENVSKKIKTLGSGISGGKNSEIFIRERAQSRIGIDRIENKNHLEKVSFSPLILENTMKPKEIVKHEKIITQHLTTSENSYTVPNGRESSLETTQSSNYPHSSQIPSISQLRLLEMSLKPPTNSQALYLRENEPEESFQTSSTLKLPHSNKIMSPQQEIEFPKKLISKEDSHSDVSTTPHTFSKRQNLSTKPIFSSELPYPKKGATPHLFNHPETTLKETVTLRNIHSSDFPTTQFAHSTTGENVKTSKLSLSETPESTSSLSETPKLTLLSSEIPNLKKNENFNFLHQHETPSKKSSTLENAHLIKKFTPESPIPFVQKTSNLEHSHFEKISTIHSSPTAEKGSKSVSVIPNSSDLKKIVSSQNDFRENPVSFYNHSMRNATIHSLLECETASEHQISTHVHHSNESFNGTKISLDLVGSSHQSNLKGPQKSQHHTTTLNPVIASLLKKIRNPQLIEKLGKLRENVTPRKQNFGKASTHLPPHLNKKISSETASPQKSHIDGKNPSLYHHSPQLNLDKISHLHQDMQPSHLEKASTIGPSHLSEVSLKGTTLPMRSHSENHLIPQPVNQHKKSAFSEKISTLQPTHSTPIPYKGTTSPQRFHVEIHSTPQHFHHHFTPQPPPSFEISSKEAILPKKFHADGHSIPKPVQQQHHHLELTHFEKPATYQPTHSIETFFRGIPQKSHDESSTLLEVPTKETILHQISHQTHPISETGHHHLHVDNLEKIISHLQSRSTEPSSKTSPQTFHKDESFKMLPQSKSSHFATEVTIAHPQHFHPKSFPKPTTKLPELHLKEKSTHSTPPPLHYSTTHIEPLHHPTIDNTTWLILEAIKRLEKEKIEEIKNLQKSQLEASHKKRISNLSHATTPLSDASPKDALNKIHTIDGTSSHAPNSLKHEVQDRSGIRQDIRIPHTHHDITKPYPMSPTTYAMLENDLEVVGKNVKPLPPLNPNDNWKYLKKLDHYYAKQKQSTTPQPRTIHPPTIPPPKPRATAAPVITSSSTMAPTTVAPRVRPSTPTRNTTKRLNQQATSTAAPSTQKTSPVNYNINSTINRNYNITVNFVPPDSAPRENNEVEDQSEGDPQVTDDEPDPFTSLARLTEMPKKSKEDFAGHFDSPQHPSIPRQSPKLSNSSIFSSLNETAQQSENSTTSNGISNNEPISFVQTKITPGDDSFPVSNTLEDKNTILQSPTPYVTKSPDSSTSATTPYQEIIKNLKSLTLKVQSQPSFENVFSSTQPSTTLPDTSNSPLQAPTICSNGNNTQQKCNNIIIISNKTEELMEILRLLSVINTDNKELSAADSSPSPILQSARSSQAVLPPPQTNPFAEIKSLLRSIRKTQMTPSEVIELRKSIGDLLRVLKQRRSNELNRLYLSKMDPMVGECRDCVQSITQINEYVELLELMMVYLARDPNKLLDEMKDARFDNFESPYPQDDPQRRLIEDQFYFVNPKILNEFIDVYKKYSKNEPYFGKPSWQFSQENGPRRASNSKPRSLGGSLNNLFHFDELIPALTYNRAPMYRPGIQYEGY